MFLVAEVAGLDEVGDAPEIHQPVLQRRAGEGEALVGLELFDGLGDLRGRVLDELRFVENGGAEGELLQFLEVAAEEGVVGDDDVVLRDLFAQVVTGGAALQDEHLHVRREALGFATPVVQDGRGADDENGFGVLAVAMLEPGDPGERLQRFAEAHVVGEDAAELDVREVAEEVEALLLIRTQLGLDVVRQRDIGNALEVGELLLEDLGLGAVRETLDAGVVEVRGLFETDLLWNGAKLVHAEIGHGFVRILHGVCVELDPAGVRQFDEAAGGDGEALQVGRAEFHAFLFPFRRDAEPVDAAAFDDEQWLELARGEEEAVKGRVAEILRLLGLVGPGAGERRQEVFIGVTDPDSGFRREPIQASQPVDRRIEAGVFEDFGFVGFWAERLVESPLLSGPMPDALVALAGGEEAEADGVFVQFEDKLWDSLVCDAEGAPIHSAVRMSAAELRAHAAAELVHGNRRRFGPVLEQGRRRDVAQEIERLVDKGQRGTSGEELRLGQRPRGAVGQGDVVGEGQLVVAALEMRSEGDNLAVELKVFILELELVAQAPARQPLEQIEAGEDHGIALIRIVAVGVGQPLNHFPVLRREELLLVSSAGGQLDDLGHGTNLFPGARAEEIDPDLESVERGMIRRGLDGAEETERGARSVEMHRGGREQPVFQFIELLLLLLGLLQFGKARDVGVRDQFRRKRTRGAEEEDGDFFEARFSGGGHQPRPPVLSAKVFSRQCELLEIILQQQPRALGVRAGGEDAQDFLALGDP